MRKYHLWRLLAAMAITAMLLGTGVSSVGATSQSNFGIWVMYRTWSRTDQPVQNGEVSRTWMWGPGPNTQVLQESYKEAPNGVRNVVYFDKTRMEENTWRSPAPQEPWDVTNGLLAKELITGQEQVGDNTFQCFMPANVFAVGDNVSQNPTYAMFQPLMGYQPLPNGWVIDQQLQSNGTVFDNAAFIQYGVKTLNVGAPTNHNVASVFWDFMNSSGVIFDADHGVTTNGPLFQNPFYATGYPLTEPYWVNAIVGGKETVVLVQIFERRVLTYTPSNPAGWQVEAGNVGLQYYAWRYQGGQVPCGSNAAPTPPPPPPSSGNANLGQCATHVPTHADMDSLARATFDQVQAGQIVTDKFGHSSYFFHPIYKQSSFDSSGGTDGMYSWFFTYCVAYTQGGSFHQPNGDDGLFDFNHSEVNACYVIVVHTDSTWFSQFMDGDPSQRAGLNIKTNPQGPVWLVNKDGSLSQQFQASDDGDILVLVPNDGTIAIKVCSRNDPPTLQVQFAEGPDNRFPNDPKMVNRVDGATYAWSN